MENTRSAACPIIAETSKLICRQSGPPARWTMHTSSTLQTSTQTTSSGRHLTKITSTSSPINFASNVHRSHRRHDMNRHLMFAFRISAPNFASRISIDYKFNLWEQDSSDINHAAFATPEELPYTLLAQSWISICDTNSLHLHPAD